MTITPEPDNITRLLALARAALHPPAGKRRIVLAVGCGLLVHVLFTSAVIAMIGGMFFGMSKTWGHVPWPWAAAANAALLLQFPLGHSLFLTARGQRGLSWLVPGRHGTTLRTTTYAIVASSQLLLVFTLWTPSGIIWWRATGLAFWPMATAYALSWLLLLKASFDAGAEVQSGALGWLSLLANRRPVYPDMPTTGLFRLLRQPIYAAFALTLWTVPVWTPDQLVLAFFYTLYCLFAPRLKERRFAWRYGARFHDYRATVPYMIPRINQRTHRNDVA